jgi:tetratricopeptide (TPR) repeat protein
LKIFLSHPSEITALAESIELALSGEGHDVFLDRSDLPAGEVYNERIRSAVSASDLFIFLVTPEALAPGRYTLTELQFARETWPNPAGHVLPVIVTPTDKNLVPAYLKAVTYLEPQGNVSAAVAAAVARIRKPWHRSTAVGAGVLALAMLVGAAGWWMTRTKATNRERESLVASARLAEQTGKYAAAWDLYERADTRFPGSAEIAASRQRVAMTWLDNVHITPGSETFAAIADTIEPVLAACIQSGDKTKAADCQAHVGWADFLRSRDGAAGLNPVASYQRALDLDPANVYAHAMWGFEILRTRGPLTAAGAHFTSALDSGREHVYVRHLQISGLLWRRDDESERELVRLGNDMRTSDASLQSDPIIAADRWRAWNVYYSQLLTGGDHALFLSALSPADHLATFRWFLPEKEVPADKQTVYWFMLGGFRERNGDRAAALATFQRVYEVMKRDGSLSAGGRLAEGTVAALERLSR